MKHLILSLFSLMLLLSANAQERSRIIIDIPSNQKPFTSPELNSNNFQFVIVTDRTGGHRPGIFMKGVRKLNLLQPEFVMSVGDLIEGYTEDVDVLNREWREFNGFIDSLQMPFFYVPGNHDITNQVMEDKWKELFGVTYYHFTYNEVLFLCLNSEDNKRGAGRGTIDDEQYEYVKKVLDENRNVKWTLVFMHQPLWVQEDTKRWNDLENLLAGRPHNVFAGHYHRYWKSVRNNGKYIALATTGGGSPLRGTAYGEFDHVVWVTMTDDGPILANLLLEGVWDENVVTEELVDLVRNRPYPIREEPVYVSNGMAESITSILTIRNDSDYNMHVKLNGLNNQNYHYSLSESELMVPPNDMKKVSVKVDNPGNRDLISSDPIVLDTEVSYEFPGRPDVVMQEKVRIAPVYEYRISESRKKVKLDGELTEWGKEWSYFSGDHMSGKPFDYDGREDVNIGFQTIYDDEFLYVGIDITDDEIFTSEKGSLWDQDAIVMALDARAAHISAMNDGSQRNQEWIGYLRTFRENDPVYRQESLPVEVKSAVMRTEKGMSVELAIPIEYLEEMQEDWSAFRLLLGYYDVDRNGEERTEHYWFPIWGSEESIAGQGMFFR